MDIINFDTAKLAKEAGFDGSEHLDWYYTIDGKTKYAEYYEATPSNSELGDSGYAAPLQPELQEWLRSYGLHIEIYVTYSYKLTCKLTQYNWKLKKLNVKNKMQTRKSGCCHNSYEEALEEALLFTLKYMKKNGQNTKSNQE